MRAPAKGKPNCRQIGRQFDRLWLRFGLLGVVSSGDLPGESWRSGHNVKFLSQCNVVFGIEQKLLALRLYGEPVVQRDKANLGRRPLPDQFITGDQPYTSVTGHNSDVDPGARVPTHSHSAIQLHGHVKSVLANENGGRSLVGPRFDSLYSS